MGFLIFLVFAFAAGCGLSVQAGVNGRLGAESGQPVWATMASFLVGFLFLIPFTLLPRNAWPALEQIGEIRWWAWTGGLIGAAYVLATVVMAPRLGATVFFALVIAGQITMSLLLDQYGWLGFPRHALNPMRLLGTVLMVLGVFLIRRF
ncbi:MAG TPA: DMT family transporter [Acidisarcina sp.]|nr:DMT family transporter [Acidisarcina sp.]